MAASVEEVCDPEKFRLNQAIRMARTGAGVEPGFEVAIVRYLEAHCMTRSVAMAKVFRGLEVLDGMLAGNEAEESRMVALLRPFLRSSDPVIASKCVLILGRRSKSGAFLRRIMEEHDYRIRANLIEALWKRDEPDVRKLLLQALRDPHQRVIANAAYGLFLLGDPDWITGLESLLTSRQAAFRTSGIWLLKTASPPDAVERIAKFVLDPEPRVKRAAFDALVKLHGAETLARLGDAIGEHGYPVRADLIEALWGREEPEIRSMLLQALDDTHHRVIGNAAYGLFMLEAPEWLGGLEKLLNSPQPAFRKSGIWLVTAVRPPDASERIAKLIRDPDPHVKRAAFDAIAKLASRGRRNGSIPDPGGNPAMEAAVS